MFKQIFIERDLVDHPMALSILTQFKHQPVRVLEHYDEVWGKFKKPYLQKRDNLSLFIAQKKGQLVKEAPEAYGVSGERHYYFIHAYNCIYECQYCYLQGYFSTPDIVLFINHEDILKEIKTHIHQERVWFHAGEFSDSLALSHVTGELATYFNFFKEHPQAFLELRTKSINIKKLKELEPLANVIISFSISPEKIAKRIDLKTPSLALRLKAMKELKDLGFKLAIHLDPIIAMDDFREEYQQLFKDLQLLDLIQCLTYVSVGVVRFTSEVMLEVERNYSDSLLLAQNFMKSSDNKIKYPAPFRKHVLESVYQLGLEAGLRRDQLYFCME